MLKDCLLDVTSGLDVADGRPDKRFADGLFTSGRFSGLCGQSRSKSDSTAFFSPRSNGEITSALFEIETAWFR